MAFVNGAIDFDMIVGLYVNQSVSAWVNRRGGRTVEEGEQSQNSRPLRNFRSLFFDFLTLRQRESPSPLNSTRCLACNLLKSYGNGSRGLSFLQRRLLKVIVFT